jgi:hypothetical protein
MRHLPVRAFHPPSMSNISSLTLFPPVRPASTNEPFPVSTRPSLAPSQMSRTEPMGGIRNRPSPNCHAKTAARRLLSARSIITKVNGIIRRLFSKAKPPGI